jgi:hypothetical protein
MISLKRSLFTVAATAALTVLAAGCGGATSTVEGAALSSAGAAASTASASPSAAPPRMVYLAEGGSVGGTTLHDPACKAGCVLSGDGTIALWDMTWSTWGSAVADGTGTEKLDDCNPNCAAGTLHAVRVAVTLSRPVMACVAGTGKWFWTRVSFTWPDGLPATFSGDNAPLNPFDYPGITAQSAKSCP